MYRRYSKPNKTVYSMIEKTQFVGFMFSQVVQSR